MNKTKKFEVRIEDREEDWDNFQVLKVIRNGRVILEESDCGEPEDNRYYRDWSWVEGMIKKSV